LKTLLKKKFFISALAVPICFITVFALASCQTLSVNEYVGITRVMHNSDAGSQTAYPAAADWTRYEAEDAECLGSAATGIGDENLYSNGDGVKNFTNDIDADYFPDNWSGLNYVRFTVRVPEDGDYLVDVITNGPDDKTIVTRVNDGPYQAHRIDFYPNIGGGYGRTTWNSVFAIRLKLGKLRAGVDNYIYFACANSAEDIDESPWMNIDCIDIKNTQEQ
jgi:hypothetical protein